MKRPNILFIITDQQRHDTIGALGNHAIRTPALDSLVRSGTAFTKAYCPAPECVPSRCCLTFGQYPGQTRCYGNGWNFPEDGRETYMESLTRAGYRTHGIGKYHFDYSDHNRTFETNGFQTRERQEEICGRSEEDEYLSFLRARFPEITDPHGIRGDMYYMPQPAMMPKFAHPTQWVGDRAVAFLEGQARSDQPWYSYVSFVHPHPPFCPPSPWHKLYRDLDIPPPHIPIGCENNWLYQNRVQNRYKRYDKGSDLQRIRMMRAYYYACISFVDYQIGRILDTLKATGAEHDTLVVFSSDHGELLGDFGCVGKRSYHEAASRIPLLVRWPGHVPAGHTCATPVNLLEVTKTILESADVSSSTHIPEGESLVNLASRPDHDRTIFTQLYNHGRAIYTAINREWKYVYSAPDNRELFFNLLRDPGETTDLALRIGGKVTQAQQALRRLKSELFAHLTRMGEASSAIEGEDWRNYPQLSISPKPDDDLLYQDHSWAAELQRIPGYGD